jgi:hypothetical protein
MHQKKQNAERETARQLWRGEGWLFALELAIVPTPLVGDQHCLLAGHRDHVLYDGQCGGRCAGRINL